MAWMTVDETERKAIDLLDQELARSSDRAAAIIAGSLVERRLYQYLKTRLRSDPALRKEYFRDGGAFGSFHVKIDLAYMIGGLTPEARHDLHAIKNIRNKFAHVLSIDGFEDSDIAPICRRLSVLEHYLIEAPKAVSRDPVEAALHMRRTMEERTLARKTGVSFGVGNDGVLSEIKRPRDRFLWSCKVFNICLGLDGQPSLPNI